ncbi:hypothetical protein, partial [Limosilactobacillus reuteri]
KSKSNAVLREFSGGGRKLQVALKMVLKNTTSVRKKTKRLSADIRYQVSKFIMNFLRLFM